MEERLLLRMPASASLLRLPAQLSGFVSTCIDFPHLAACASAEKHAEANPSIDKKIPKQDLEEALVLLKERARAASSKFDYFPPGALKIISAENEPKSREQSHNECMRLSGEGRMTAVFLFGLRGGASFTADGLHRSGGELSAFANRRLQLPVPHFSGCHTIASNWSRCSNQCGSGTRIKFLRKREGQACVTTIKSEICICSLECKGKCKPRREPRIALAPQVRVVPPFMIKKSSIDGRCSSSIASHDVWLGQNPACRGWAHTALGVLRVALRAVRRKSIFR